MQDAMLERVSWLKRNCSKREVRTEQCKKNLLTPTKHRGLILRTSNDVVAGVTQLRVYFSSLLIHSLTSIIDESHCLGL